MLVVKKLTNDRLESLLLRSRFMSGRRNAVYTSILTREFSEFWRSHPAKGLVRAVAHQRGEEDHGHKHGHHEKDARRDTNNTPPVCCCELMAPLYRALRGHLNLWSLKCYSNVDCGWWWDYKRCWKLTKLNRSFDVQVSQQTSRRWCVWFIHTFKVVVRFIIF